MKKRWMLIGGVMALVSSGVSVLGQGATINISVDLNALFPSSGGSEYIEEVTSTYYFVGAPWESWGGVLIVLEPPGALVEVYRGNFRKFRDHAPTAFTISGSDQYEVVITLPDQRVWRKTVMLKPGIKYLLGVYASAFAPVVPASPPPPPTQPPVVEEPVCPVMNADDFSDFIGQMRDEPFADNRMDILQTAAKDNCFTVNQAKQIAEVFQFDDERLEAMKIVYPKLVDQKDVYKLYDVFMFPSTKEEFKEWLEDQD